MRKPKTNMPAEARKTLPAIKLPIVTRTQAKGNATSRVVALRTAGPGIWARKPNAMAVNNAYVANTPLCNAYRHG
jgi:hypothetical protein